MTRWKASAIHLSLSLLVLSTIAALLVWRWYPPALFHTAKADKLLALIGGIDLVLGPLLTLIVYKQGKKSLKFDLTVIALLQLAALGYGLHQVWQSRPVYLVATVDRFQLVFANEIHTEDLRNAKPEFQRLPWFGIETVGVLLSSDPLERSKALDLALAGKDIYLVPANYRPYHDAAAGLLARSIGARELLSKLPEQERPILAAAVSRSGKLAAQLAAVPIESGRGTAAMLLDAASGDVVRPVAVDPWPAIVSLRPTQSGSSTSPPAAGHDS